jgi:hypothetical protein
VRDAAIDRKGVTPIDGQADESSREPIAKSGFVKLG